MATLRNVSDSATGGSEIIQAFYDEHRSWGDIRVENLDNDTLTAIKANLASFAYDLDGETRIRLYKDMQATANMLKDMGVDVSYNLDDSFISTSEAQLAMLKYIQTGKTQEECADYFSCNRKTVQKWQRDTADGWRLGDMRIQEVIANGGKMESYVHPVLLPLNLTQVYGLLKAVKTYEKTHRREPAAAVASEVADMIYGQLTENAKAILEGGPLGEFEFDENVPSEFHREVRGVIAGVRSLLTYSEKARNPIWVLVNRGGKTKKLEGRAVYWRDCGIEDDDPRYDYYLQDEEGNTAGFNYFEVIDFGEIRKRPSQMGRQQRPRMA